jgi:hypothetical protein
MSACLGHCSFTVHHYNNFLLSFALPALNKLLSPHSLFTSTPQHCCTLLLSLPSAWTALCKLHNTFIQTKASLNLPTGLRQHKVFCSYRNHPEVEEGAAGTFICSHPPTCNITWACSLRLWPAKITCLSALQTYLSGHVCWIRPYLICQLNLMFCDH